MKQTMCALTVIAMASIAAQSDALARSLKCPAPGPYAAADLSLKVDQVFLTKMKSMGITTIIRYYDWKVPTLGPEKVLSPEEKSLIAENGFSIAVVFQHNSSSPRTYLNPTRGIVDAKAALVLAGKLNQPKGSAIYFGNDGADNKFAEQGKGPPGDRFGLTLIVKYFEGVRDTLKGSGYDIGVYGSGLVCDELLGKGLVKYCWLANAMGWPDSREFYKTNRWNLRQFLPSSCGGKELDLNEVSATNPNFGQWKPN